MFASINEGKPFNFLDTRYAYCHNQYIFFKGYAMYTILLVLLISFVSLQAMQGSTLIGAKKSLDVVELAPDVQAQLEQQREALKSKNAGHVWPTKDLTKNEPNKDGKSSYIGWLKGLSEKNLALK